jgi:hypothetical protein
MKGDGGMMIVQKWKIHPLISNNPRIPCFP